MLQDASLAGRPTKYRFLKNKSTGTSISTLFGSSGKTYPEPPVETYDINVPLNSDKYVLFNTIIKKSTFSQVYTDGGRISNNTEGVCTYWE